MTAVVPPDPLPPDENVGPALTIINSILISFILITTCIRVFVRFSIRALGMDDYTIIVVAILCVVRFALQVVQVNSFGNGRHRWYISEEDYMNNNRLGWYCLVLLFVTMCLLKISICLLLLRIKDERNLKMFVYAIMAGLVITNFGCVIILLAQCRPISVYWTGAGGVCWDTRVRIYAIYGTIGELLPRLNPAEIVAVAACLPFAIAYSIVTDIICSLLPLVVVWNVHLPLKKKAMVCSLMGLGIV